MLQDIFVVVFIIEGLVLLARGIHYEAEQSRDKRQREALYKRKRLAETSEQRREREDRERDYRKWDRFFERYRAD